MFLLWWQFGTFGPTCQAPRAYVIMTRMNTKIEQKRAAAAARQARYVERRRAAGYTVGATVRTRDLAAVQAPAVQQALEQGQGLGAALSLADARALKVGQRVLALVRAGGWRGWVLRRVLSG